MKERSINTFAYGSGDRPKGRYEEEVLEQEEIDSPSSCSFFKNM